MLEILGVKRANYYKWLRRNKSERDLENEELADFIRKYDEKFNHTLGYRMMTDRINRDENKNYNDKRVYKVMKILGIKSIIRPKRRSCTVRKSNNTAKNNLKRDFNASRPNEKWVTDVTEFKYGKNNENKLYLSLILDLYDRYPVGYEINDRNDNRLVFNTFRSAVEANPGAHPLFHSSIRVLSLCVCLRIMAWNRACPEFTAALIMDQWKDSGEYLNVKYIIMARNMKRERN